MPAPSRIGQPYKMVLVIKKVLSDQGFLNTPTQYRDLQNFISSSTPSQAKFSVDDIKAWAECDKPVDPTFLACLLQAAGKDYNNLENFISHLENEINAVTF